eukprot:TRINITY_DN1231_c0_g1_i1.p1 TRINITY_DN1231_c0_g1~~TRINITY_DN1231_c0_g1_i1.p1  ORF type:complete len:327 (-),score=51.13 TRINITY_DN1231_c0_g1_i1:23-1003(-)
MLLKQPLITLLLITLTLSQIIHTQPSPIDFIFTQHNNQYLQREKINQLHGDNQLLNDDQEYRDSQLLNDDQGHRDNQLLRDIRVQKDYWQSYMIQLTKEFGEMSDKKNCSGAVSYLSSTGYFEYPYDVDAVFTREDWMSVCQAESRRVTSSFSLGDTAAEETNGFLVYQFDKASVIQDSAGFHTRGMKGIGITGFTGFYKMNIVSGYYDNVNQVNASDIRMFIFTVLTALERGDCDFYSTSFTRRGEYMHDAMTPVTGRPAIRASCRDFISAFKSFSLTIEDVYVNGDGAAAYWHFIGVDLDDKAYISNTFSFFSITPSMKIEKNV